MAISVNWPTGVISVPQSYLTFISGVLYELDVNQLRLDLKDLEDSEEGSVWPTTHNHNTQVVLSGVTYARSFEVINGYTIEFENGMYTVRCTGANHNIADVKVANSVSLIIGNSAGLIVVNTTGTIAPTQQQIRNAMAIAATALPVDGSIDDKLNDIKRQTNLIPTLL